MLIATIGVNYWQQLLAATTGSNYWQQLLAATALLRMESDAAGCRHIQYNLRRMESVAAPDSVKLPFLFLSGNLSFFLANSLANFGALKAAYVWPFA